MRDGAALEHREFVPARTWRRALRKSRPGTSFEPALRRGTADSGARRFSWRQQTGTYMKTLIRASLVFLVLAAGVPIAVQAEEGEAELRALAMRWEHAWNRHDMKALAALFTGDADFVNVGARHWKGRNEIEAQHAARLDQFRQSRWTTKDVTVQFLTHDVALVHVVWGLTGDKDPDGTARQPREGVFTWVVVKERADWLIRAAQNTNRGNLPSPPAVK